MNLPGHALIAAARTLEQFPHVVTYMCFASVFISRL
jgi:hypothetical protein